jgi:PAS domain S-box-containing protein
LASPPNGGSGHRRAAGGFSYSRRWLYLLVGVLWAAAVALVALTDAADVAALAFVPVIALVAATGGTGAGAVAGLAGAGLDVAGGLAAGVGQSAAGTAVEAVSLILTGAGIGRLSQWLADEAAKVVQARHEAEEVEAMFRAVFDGALDAILIVDDDYRVLDANRAVEKVLGCSRDELIGRRGEDFAPPERIGRLEGLQRDLRARRVLRGDYEFVAQDGKRRSLEFTATADFLPGRHLAVLRDCTDSVLSREALELRTAQQAAIAQLGLLAFGGLSPHDLMREVVSRVATTLGVEHVAILEGRPGGGPRQLRAGVAWSESDPAVEDANSGVTVAVHSRESVWGTLEVRSSSPRRFSGHGVDFLRSVANILATAIEAAHDSEELHRRSAEIARLAADRQRIVAEAMDAEDRARERISQQLHDELLQSLFVIRQDLAQAANGRPDLLARARDGVGQAIRDLRASVFDLHPVVLAQGGLRSAIGAVAEHHAGVGGFEATVDVAGGVDGEFDRLCLSLVRELLANVVRHAGAQHAEVRLSRSPTELVLEVADDGRGVDRAAAREAVARGHIGLASAAQRVEAVGGRLELHDRPGGGTVVRVSIPQD